MTSPVSLVVPGSVMLRGPGSGVLSVGLLLPLSGVMGIAGPSILNFALLAGEHVADRFGVVLELVLIDTGRGPVEVARTVDQLVDARLVDGLVGAHTSDVRVAVARVVADRVPYIFTPPHERERGGSGTIFLGSNPRLQLQRPLEWVTGHHRTRRWALIGNDYVWPSQVHRAASGVLRSLGQTVVMDRLVPFGSVDPERLLDEARKNHVDAVLLSLIGRDGITFHRHTNESGDDQRLVRLSTALDENCLLAAGGDGTGTLYSAMPTFIRQQDDRHLGLLERYHDRFGRSAPLPASYAEGCYEGVVRLVELRRSGAPFSGPAAASRLARADGHELVVIGDTTTV